MEIIKSQIKVDYEELKSTRSYTRTAKDNYAFSKCKGWDETRKHKGGTKQKKYKRKKSRKMEIIKLQIEVD